MHPHQPKNRDAQLHPQVCLSPKSMLLTNILDALIHSTTRQAFLKEKKKVKSLSHVWLFATPWNVAYQTPPSMGFSRQEYWSGLPFPSPGDLPNPLTDQTWVSHIIGRHFTVWATIICFSQNLLTCPIAVVKFHPTAKYEGRAYIRLPLH